MQFEPRVRAFVATRRVARLATADAQGVPHVVPICYVFDGLNLYSALDRKPKRVAPRRLRRVRNIAENPRVAVVVDDYSEDWSCLAYVLIQGRAEMLEDGEERAAAESMLRDKYPQYAEMLEEGCAVLKVTADRVTSWGRV